MVPRGGPRLKSAWQSLKSSIRRRQPGLSCVIGEFRPVRELHVTYCLIYAITTMLVGLALTAFRVNPVPGTLTVIYILATILAFLPMRLCFRDSEYLSLGWSYLKFLIGAAVAPGLYYLVMSGFGSHEVPQACLPYFMVVMASSMALFCYALPARVILARGQG